MSTGSELLVDGLLEQHTPEEKATLVNWLDSYDVVAPYDTNIIKALVDDLDSYNKVTNPAPYNHLIWHIPAGSGMSMREAAINKINQYVGE